MCTDMGTEMGMPLLPSLIAGLGGGALALGLIDGLADAVAAALQAFSGRWSDRSRRRKPFVALGYGISGFLRPLFGFAAAPWQVVAVRSGDRIGKGLRKPAMNSLLEGAAAEGTRGRVFGFHDAMDNAGQLLGPLLAVALLALYAGDVRKVLLWAAVPGVLAFIAVVGGVSEVQGPPASARSPRGLLPPKELLPALLPIAVFSLGNASDLFLLFKVQKEGAPLWAAALLWAGFAGVKVLSALAGGPLADRLGPKAAITLGWFWYACIYAAFAVTHSLVVLTGLFLAYGLFHGLSEGPQKALIGSLAAEDGKASAYGWLGWTTGLLALPAGALFGGLWEWQGPASAFGCGAVLAALGAGMLWWPQGAEAKA